MPTVLEDLNTSAPTVAALQNSIATFTLIASGIRTEINEFLSDTYGVGSQLKNWKVEMSDGSDYGWVADRTRFLNATVGFPIHYSLTTVATSYKATFPAQDGLFGDRQSYYGNLGGLSGSGAWLISQSLSGNPHADPGLLPISARESIGVYAGGSLVLSATRLDAEIYSKDRYNLYLNDKTFRFVCRYLNETPLNVTQGNQCRGLVYSLSAIEMGTTSMKNQITFTTLKQAELSRLF